MKKATIITLAFGIAIQFCAHAVHTNNSQMIQYQQQEQPQPPQLQPQISIINPTPQQQLQLSVPNQQQMAMLQQLQQMPQKPQPKTKPAQEDQDFGPQILSAFFGQVVPAFVDIIAGEENKNSARTASGAKNFFSAVFEIAGLMARSPESFEKLLASLEQELEHDENLHELITDMTRSIKKLSPVDIVQS